MQRVVDIAETGLRWVAALCLFALTVLVVFQVAMRYGYGGVPFFTEELARYAMIWMAMLAAAVAVREESHIRIDLVPTLLQALAPRVRVWLDLLLDAISLTVFLVLIWYGIDMVIFAAGQTSDGMRITLSYPYAAVPAAFLFATIFAVAKFLERRRAE